MNPRNALIERRRFRATTWLSIATIALASSETNAALIFDFAADPGTPQHAIDAFSQAGQLWSDIFADDVTINVRIGFSDFRTDPDPQNDSAIGASDSNFTYLGEGSYESVYNALTADATSGNDLAALALLQPPQDYDRVVNTTLNNPNGVGSDIPYIDTSSAFNASVFGSSANLKALGLLSLIDNPLDGEIFFNSAVPSWDFDRSDGITGLDFIGTAAHEIGHVLGFLSVIDEVDGLLIHQDRWIPSIMDLFRFSDDIPGLPDISIDAGNEYFALTGQSALFCNARSIDCQASHWADDLGLGLMDPSATSNQINGISALDITLFDTIGWTLHADEPIRVPEPSTWLLLATGFFLVHLRRRMSHSVRHEM